MLSRQHDPIGIDVKSAIGYDTIALSGRLSSIQIVNSSGDKKLDQRVIDAVRQAVFPTPPPGITVSLLTYEIPYQFRQSE